MGTRSTISIKTKDNKFKTIYCHWDGYPSNNGRLLLEHYGDEKKVKELIELGDISSLAPMVAPYETSCHVKREFTSDGIVEKKIEGCEHSYDTPHKNVVVAYGRDRGETDIKARVVDNKKDIQQEEYEYLFEDGIWKLRRGDKWYKLTENMCKK